MATVRITTNDGSRTIEATSISDILVFNRYNLLRLGKPVRVDGVEMPEDAYIDFGENAVVEIDDNNSLNGLVSLVMENGYGEIRCYIPQNNMLMLQAAPDALGDPIELNDISGGIGPFVYNVSIHLDTEDFTRSYFAISLSFMNVKLCNAVLDANNPKISFGTSILGVGAKGVLGVDFNNGRIYVEAELAYYFDTKKYTFDLYNWKNYSVQLVPSGNSKKALKASSNADLGGRISIENRGAYVAKFTVSFDLEGKRVTCESDNFTAGVTKSIEIPAGATNIQLCAMDAWFIGQWNDIFTKAFKGPVMKKYRISGTTLNTSYEEIAV